VLASDHGTEWLVRELLPTLADHLIARNFTGIVTSGGQGHFLSHRMAIGTVHFRFPAAD
jgi:glycine cleavage system aminomethyltransferase T